MRERVAKFAYYWEFTFKKVYLIDSNVSIFENRK